MELDWLHWHPEPGVLDGLVVISVLYALAVGPLRRFLAPEKSFPKKEACWFYGSVLLLFLAVGTPLDEIGEKYLFTAHMLQHTILIYPVPVMMLLGTPDWVLKPIVNLEWSRPLFYFLTRPVVAFLLFNACFTIWHIPGFYEWALRDPQIHFLEHATFILTALLAWWPVIPRVEEFPGLHPGGQLLYLLAMGIAQSPVFAFLTFSGEVFYPTYEAAPRLLAMSAMEDQVVGGILMKLAGMAAMLGAMVVVFYRWYVAEGSGPALNVGEKGPVPLGLGDQVPSVEDTLDEADQARGGQ